MNYADVRFNERRMKRMYKSSAAKARNKINVLIMRIFLILVVVAGSGGVMVVAGAYMSIIEQAPDISHIFHLIEMDGNFNSVIVDWRGNEVVRLTGAENRDFVSSAEIPDHVKLAFIAREDERFFEHNGIDFRAMVRALWATVQGRTEGASTITQQVIKMQQGIRFNSFITKLQEQILAVNFERQLTEMLGSREAAKDRILEIYLNDVHLGSGTYGVQAAARRYFNKDVWELTLSEATVIAATTSNPTRLNPIWRQEANARRREGLLNTMLDLNFITQDEFDEAMADNVHERITAVQQVRQAEPSVRSWFDDEVIRQVVDDLVEQFNLTRNEAFHWVYSGGLRIYSTQNAEIQAVVDNVFKNNELFPQREFHIEVAWSATIRNENTGITRNVNNRGQRHQLAGFDDIPAYIERQHSRHLREGNVIVSESIIPTIQPQASIVVMDHSNGHVVAIAGGRGEKAVDMGLNRINSVRQPGSTTKTFVYAAGLDTRTFTAATVFDDTPFLRLDRATSEVTWRPGNWWGSTYRGLSTVRQGMIDSMNIIAVRALDAVGVQTTRNYFENFGFTTLDPRDTDLAPLALGGMTHGLTTLEMTAAYAAIANGGVYIEPIFYTLVLDHAGNVLLDNTEPRTRQVMRSTTAYILTDTMVDVIRAGTGTRARLSGNMPAAGKTGTTSETNDLWFAGYTPYFAATVWLGHDMPRGLSSATRGGRYHLALWHNVMDEIHRNLPVRQFPRPTGIERHTVCTASGLLPVPGLCEHNPVGHISVRQEWFEVGTEPREQCNVCVRYDFCVGIQDVTPWALPTQFCPADHIVRGQVGIRRPNPILVEGITVRDAWAEMPRAYCTVHNQWGTVPVNVTPNQEHNDEPYLPTIERDYIIDDPPIVPDVWEDVLGGG